MVRVGLVVFLATGPALSAAADVAAEGGGASDSQPSPITAPVETDVGVQAAINDSPNGFDLSQRIVPRDEIKGGGPPRDHIHSVDAPEFVSPELAIWAPPTVPAIGVARAGQAHAFPVHLMEYHQIVNDTIGGDPVVVSYDPLSGVPRAFLRRVGDRVLTFGVSGLLHRGQFVLYDRETESLWAQLEGQAIAGPLAGKRLERLVVRQEPLSAWFEREPGMVVMTRPERMKIDYRYSPYEAYWVSEKIPFEPQARDDRYHPKEVVLGVEVDGHVRAYLGSILVSAGGRIVDDFYGRKLRIDYRWGSGTFVWEVPPDVQVTDAYWFAWKSYRPATEIWHDAVKAESSSP